MALSPRWVVLGSLLAAACGEANSPTAPAPASDTGISPSIDAPGEEALGTPHIHAFVTKPLIYLSQSDDQGDNGNNGGDNGPISAARSSRTTSGTGISWHGGAVMHTVNVATIYWGTNSPMYPGGPAAGTKGTGSGDGSLIGTYLRSVGGSHYWNINTDYYDGSVHVPAAVTYTQYWAHNVNPGTSPSDAAIQAEITGAFSSGNLAYDANTIYAVFTGPGVNLGGGFLTQYCAYHGRFSWNGKQVIYSAQPYNDHQPSCSWQNTGPNGIDGDATVNTLAHEVDEAATDPYLNAWYDTRGYENADKCAWTFGATSTASNGALYNLTLGGTNFLIQRNWLNRNSGGCSLGF
jgi:hypothetical protein